MTVDIDFNSMSREGFILTRHSKFEHPVTIGQLVPFLNTSGEVQGFARVASVYPDYDLVHLDVDWDSVVDIPGTEF